MRTTLSSSISETASGQQTGHELAMGCNRIKANVTPEVLYRSKSMFLYTPEVQLREYRNEKVWHRSKISSSIIPIEA